MSDHDMDIAKYKKWLRTFGCITPRQSCSGPIDLHHVKSRGAGGKDKANLVPLCHAHHMEGHTRGWVTFQNRYEVDLQRIAVNIWSAYEERRAVL
jgi:hypothetical protein